jgi:hypothetical protein
MEEGHEKIDKILPLFHILICAFTYGKFNNKEKMKELASKCHEFRMLPLPYGLLPHEAIEIIDNERIIPGITKAFKLGEDFPYLDYHSINKGNEDAENFY